MIFPRAKTEFLGYSGVTNLLPEFVKIWLAFRYWSISILTRCANTYCFLNRQPKHFRAGRLIILHLLPNNFELAITSLIHQPPIAFRTRGLILCDWKTGLYKRHLKTLSWRRRLEFCIKVIFHDSIMKTPITLVNLTTSILIHAQTPSPSSLGCRESRARRAKF